MITYKIRYAYPQHTHTHTQAKKERYAKAVHRKLTHPLKPSEPTQKSANLMPVMVSGGSLPPKTDLGGFSSPKPNETDPTNKTHERKPNLPRSAQIW